MSWVPTKLDFSGGYLIVTYEKSEGETLKQEEILRVNQSTLSGFDEVRLDLIRQLREHYGYNVAISQRLYTELEKISEEICRARGEEFPLSRKTRGARVPGSQKWLRTKAAEERRAEEMDFIRATW